MERETTRIWNDFSGKLRGYLRHHLKSAADVDDVLQDVFLRVHRHAGQLGHEAHLSGWLFTVARSALVDLHRRRRVGPPPDREELAGDPEPDPSAHAGIAAGLREIIDALPEKYARALTLVDLQGVPFREAAQTLGISVSGAKSRVQRARVMVRDALMQCCHFVIDRYGTILEAQRACCCCAEPSRPPAGHG